MQYYYVLVVGISTSEIPFRAVDIRSFVAAATRLPPSMWRVLLSNADDTGGPRSVVAAGIRFVYPGDNRRINAAGRIPHYPSGTFSLVISDARSPEIEPTELVRLLKPGGVACVARVLPPRRAAPRRSLARSPEPPARRYYGNWAALVPGTPERDVETELAGDVDVVVEPLGTWPLRHPIERGDQLAYYGVSDPDDRAGELALRQATAKYMITRLPAGAYYDFTAR